ncbi:MAG: hypothetical protein ABW328_00215 [Ilumatobacteraceae bacterium]
MSARRPLLLPRPAEGDEGSGLTPEALHAALDGQLPRFMVPRYIIQLDELPTTPRERVRTSELREAHDVDACWDAGVVRGGARR